ncbi:MAG: ornithine carbamoyltransferase [Candidatus Dormibacteria bacterium]
MNTRLAGRDLLSIADLSRDDIVDILDHAQELKSGQVAPRPLAGKNVGMIFQRPSNRTRVSFEVAIQGLGGHPIPIFSQEIQLGQRESTADVARILDRYLDGIVARLHYQSDLEGIALNAKAPVISAMTDAEHPCQILADLLTIRENFGDGAVVTYIGDGNNVCNSWIYAAAIMGFELRLVIPEGYEPHPSVARKAAAMGYRELGSWAVNTAMQDTAVIYTDVWTSMGQEDEHERRRQDFSEYQVNRELVSLAPASARVMHCLPAHRGEEITDEVIDGPQSIVFDQAENRLHVQKAILSLIYAE